MGLFDKLQARFELYKLEQRYTKRKRRTTFISEAYYADGEYHYGPQSPGAVSTSSTGSSRSKHAGKRASVMGAWDGRRY